MATMESEMLELLRARIKRDLERDAAGPIVNNVYAGGSQEPPRGVAERMAAGAGEDPFDYRVMIARRDQKDAEGNPQGWNKMVHRYRVPKDGEDPYADLIGVLKKKGGGER